MNDNGRTDPLVAYRDLPIRDGMPCSWGIWGSHDVLGTLNFLTDDNTRAAAAEIQRGARFCLDLPWDEPSPPVYGRPSLQHQVEQNVGFGGISSFSDDLVTVWNTQSSSQWDGFRHVERDAHGWYSGIPSREHGMHHWARRGFVARGLLLDVGRWRESVGRPIRYDIPDPIEPADLIECISAQGVQCRVGDVLLIRTGWIEWYRSLADERRAEWSASPDFQAPGLRASERMAELLWDLHVSAVAADNPGLETSPVGGAERTEDDAAADPEAAQARRKGLHVRLLPMLGIPIGELFWLGDLAADCAVDQRYTGLLVSAPVNITGAVASPPNAVFIK